MLNITLFRLRPLRFGSSSLSPSPSPSSIPCFSSSAISSHRAAVVPSSSSRGPKIVTMAACYSAATLSNAPSPAFAAHAGSSPSPSPSPSPSCSMLAFSSSSCSRQQQGLDLSLRPSFFSSGPKLSSLSHLNCAASKTRKAAIRAMASDNGTGVSPGLSIDLRGKRAFIAGVADDQGYGWAIAKALAAAGAEILIGTWVPAMNIFETSFRRGKFDESRRLPNDSLMEIAKVYPLDAVFDSMDDVPEDIRTNKRYAGYSKWTVQEAAECVKEDFGSIDILVHSLANGPEVTKPLLETSRRGYLAAVSASSYSYVSLLKHFGPFINPGGSSLSLTYIASEKIIPGYGGGMSSAKAALESDTRVLAFEAGRKYNIRVNTISADDVGNAAAFLASPLASAITGSVVYVDNGLHAMGLAPDSPSLSQSTAVTVKTGVAA